MGGIVDAVGDVVHTVGDVLTGGALSANKAKKEAIKAAKDASNKSYQISKEQLEFQRQQYEDWKSIYGDLQQQLGEYFKNLTGDSIAAQRITQLQKATQSANKQIEQMLAQRGLANSGLEASLEAQNIMNAEMQKANIKANKDQLAAMQKMQFLGLGLGQGTQMLGINASVANAAAGNAMSFANANLGLAGAALSGQLAGMRGLQNNAFQMMGVGAGYMMGGAPGALKVLGG